jgi:hypothetical protein
MGGSEVYNYDYYGFNFIKSSQPLLGLKTWKKKEEDEQYCWITKIKAKLWAQLNDKFNLFMNHQQINKGWQWLALSSETLKKASSERVVIKKALKNSCVNYDGTSK